MPDTDAGFDWSSLLDPSSPWSLLTMGGASAMGNVPSWITQMQRAKEQEKYRRLLSDPAAFAAFASGMPSTLNADVVNAVAGNVKNDLVSRGLVDAPGFTAKSIGGALGPLVAEDTARRQQLALGMIRDAYGMVQPAAGGFDISGIFRQWLQQKALADLREEIAASKKNQAAGGFGSGVGPYGNVPSGGEGGFNLGNVAGPRMSPEFEEESPQDLGAFLRSIGINVEGE